MYTERRFVPHVLLGTLLLGSGLGVGFGVAESTLTYNAAIENSALPLGQRAFR
jgi:hypothetical protein